MSSAIQPLEKKKKKIYQKKIPDYGTDMQTWEYRT